jgi:hypothetical protein
VITSAIVGLNIDSRLSITACGVQVDPCWRFTIIRSCRNISTFAVERYRLKEVAELINSTSRDPEKPTVPKLKQNKAFGTRDFHHVCQSCI